MLIPTISLVAALVGAQAAAARNSTFLGWDQQYMAGNLTNITTEGVHKLNTTIRSFDWYSDGPGISQCCIRTCPNAGWDKSQKYCNSTSVAAVLPQYQFDRFTLVCGSTIELLCQ